jgi:hypothetical protein
MSNLPVGATSDTEPPESHDTDHTQLKPYLPPTNEDISCCMRAVLGEMQGIRVETINLKSSLLELKGLLVDLTNHVLDQGARMGKCETHVTNIQTKCNYRHGNGHSDPNEPEAAEVA